MPNVRLIAGMALASALFAVPAAAKDNDYCLSCRGPDQTYLCRVTGAPPRSDALKLYCVIRAAKEGGHSSCAARNDASDCPGILKEYAYVAPDLSAGFAVREGTLPGPPALQGTPEAGPRGPKTLVEAIGASRRGIRGAFRKDNDKPEEGALPVTATEALLPELPAGASAPDPIAEKPVATTDIPGSAEEETDNKPRTALGRGVKNMGIFARGAGRCMRSLFRECRKEEDNSQADSR